MNYRNLGNTGLKVSEVGFGGEHLEGKPFEQVEKAIHAALDGGINILDIFMSNPEVRSNIGNALGSRRREMIIQGHIGSGWVDGQYIRSRDLDRCKVFYEDLLTRLNTDYMDIAMVHYVDTIDDLHAAIDGGLFDFARELKRTGAAKAVGVSSHDTTTARKMVEMGLIDVMMFSINPAYDAMPATTDLDALFDAGTYAGQQAFTPSNERAELYRLCDARGVGITVMKGLGAGTLLDAARSPFGTQMTVHQLMHYALTRPAVSSVLLGCKTAEEIAHALAYESVSDEEKDYSMALKNAPKYSMKGKCMYCNHCLPCPMHIDIAAVNKFLDLSQLPGDVPPSVKEHYLALSSHASDCIACRQCESNCPFGVEIADRMAKAAEVFGV